MVRFGYFGVAVVFASLAIGQAAGQVTCPVLSGGGAVHSDGTILVLGQFATGIASGATDSTAQGAVPCWLDQTRCQGDLNGDQDVDLQDLATLLAHFGTTGGATLADGDLDGDADVDLQDLASILSAFGSNCP